jgi:hypothetical protein
MGEVAVAEGCLDMCACEHVPLCMLGCLSNLVVGFFKEKTFLLAVARTTGTVLCPSSPFGPLPLS